MQRYANGLFIIAVALAHIAIVAPAKTDNGKDMMVASAYGGGGGGGGGGASYGGSSSSYSAPAAAPAAPAASYGGGGSSYGGGGSSYGGGGSSYSAPSQPASIPAPPCPKNYIISCQPALSPVACSAPSSGGYGSAAAYSQYVPAYALPPYGYGY